MGPILWKTLHILAAMWVTVGVFATAVVFAVLKRTSDPAGRALGLRLALRLTTVYSLPGALLSGVLGIYTLMVQGLAFHRGWVHTSLLLWLLLTATILFIQMPRLKAAVSTGGAVSPLVAMVSHVNALFIVVMVFLMTFKPF